MDQIFPDEVFLEIFRYSHSLDLFRGFYNLNSRLNGIIRKVGIYLCHRFTNEEQRHILPNLSPKQIRSFYVCEEQYEYPYLNECINIRELTFDWQSEYDVYHIIHRQLVFVQPANFPHLRSLMICQQSGTFEYHKLCTLIFGNQFPVLEDLHLPYANGSCIKGIKTWSTSLITVHIECCNKSMLYPLLDNLPNLQNFTCTPGTPGKGSLKNQRLALKQFNLTNYDQNSPHHSTIMEMNEIENLFRCFPNLETTILILYYYGTLNDAFRALHAVLSHCPKLKRIDCYMKYLGPNCSEQAFDEVKSRYPLFRDYYLPGAWKEHGSGFSKGHDGYRFRITKR